jgi:hypothetical protein
VSLRKNRKREFDRRNRMDMEGDHHGIRLSQTSQDGELFLRLEQS